MLLSERWKQKNMLIHLRVTGGWMLSQLSKGTIIVIMMLKLKYFYKHDQVFLFTKNIIWRLKGCVTGLDLNDNLKKMNQCDEGHNSMWAQFPNISHALYCQRSLTHPNREFGCFSQFHGGGSDWHSFNAKLLEWSQAAWHADILAES